MALVTISDIRAAAALIAPVVVRTPLLRFDDRLSLKPENLQPVGAFKIRGAYHALARLPEQQRARGVVAYSSGNHAQAVAFAAREFGVPATIVVPENAPEVKIAATRAWGAEVVLVPMAQRESRAHELAEERGTTLIPPFDHPDVIAGQGTVGLEVVEDAPAVDVVLVPVSGGGLISGVAAAVKALRPAARVVGVEPAFAADAAESLRAGELVRWPAADRERTSADGLRAEPSDLTFAHIQTFVDDIVTVTEEQIADAVRRLAGRARLVVEPSGAVAVAAYLADAERWPQRTVAVVSGGNIDPAAYLRLLSA
ncbi:threonine/serine dehydratase [Actinosynnema sp. NPDC047251]|uniref:threonine ammonia-lyase n=1 Tax=Saccharothrix espanaensis (strain ATCC 51144 / DSM 44229 / JCM 9112 / NBRC 15066 / NRRL 15764) TaxID=1179773 RepID=K0JNU2_SACES|nr:threonine/serine dehydratase [Saccharothrix espanaensis]CCH27780.1 putative threo-3-hydroxyaspartate ammonia-lyase [Saccharothrix espanaensis DSM 44229]